MHLVSSLHLISLGFVLEALTSLTPGDSSRAESHSSCSIMRDLAKKVPVCVLLDFMSKVGAVLAMLEQAELNLLRST